MDKITNGRPITKIHNTIFGAMVVLTVFMTALTTIISVIVDLNNEKKNLDNNLRNIAYTITSSGRVNDEDYLDSLKLSISNVDVISVISSEGTRVYHTNKELIGTRYDGTIPDFDTNGDMYVSSDVGPSGSQRRVYAAIHSTSGEYDGFVIVVLLNQNINKLILNTFILHFSVALVIILLSVIISGSISRRIKHTLWGYEPDAFSAMYSVRDNILESFEEGIIAIDYDERILFMNKAAQRILGVGENYSLHINDYPMLSISDLRSVLKTREKLVGIHSRSESNIDAIINYYPVVEKNTLIGAICVLLDRTEYTRIAEDLSGVNFIVESMRANNHDFVNKLHVILGLVQMGKNQEAAAYISSITSIQQEIISNIMRNIENPSVAALLIGKYFKAAELNIGFALENGSSFKKTDVNFASGDLITLIGNLIENAFDAMNSANIEDKNLTVGIFTKPGAMIVRVDDSGPGIPDSVRDVIYENGVTSKGENHGTGLFIVKQIVNRYSGSIEFESEKEIGTSFTVTLIDDNGGENHV